MSNKQRKSSKITPEMMNYIRLNLDKSDEKIARAIEAVFGTHLSGQAITYQKEKILDSLPELPTECIQMMLDSTGFNNVVRYGERTYRMLVSTSPDAPEEELAEKTNKIVNEYLHSHPGFETWIEIASGLVPKRKTELKYPLKTGQKIEQRLAELDKIALKNMNQEQIVEYIKLHRYISEEPEEENENSIAIEAATTRFKRTGIVDEQFLAGKLSEEKIYEIKSSAGFLEEIAGDE